MSIFRASVNFEGRRECARCHKMFVPTKEGQIYGPRCARKMAGQVELDSQALVSGKVLHKKPDKTLSAEESAVAAYRIIVSGLN